jgi:hypothetical protein
MPQFRKKPVVVEAELFDDAFVTKYHGTMHRTGISFHHDYALINTLEGSMRAERGDWIITGVKGERYPCKPDIFAETYEPAVAADAVDPVVGVTTD